MLLFLLQVWFITPMSGYQEQHQKMLQLRPEGFRLIYEKVLTLSQISKKWSLSLLFFLPKKRKDRTTFDI